MSVNNPYSKNTIQKLIKDLNEYEIKEVVDFIEFIKEKDKKIRKAQEQRTSLQGIISGSQITDEDIKEAKKIWR